MKAFRKAALLAVASVAAAGLVPASASAEVFNFLNSNTNVGGSNDGNVRTFTGSAGTKVEVSAYSLNGNSLTKSYLGQYNPYGLGVVNSGNDNDHAIDNSGWIDYVVLQFDKVMTVNELSLTIFGDSDLNWGVGTTNTSFTPGVLNLTNLSVFGTLFDSTGSNPRAVNGGNLSGNLFLVGAADFGRFSDGSNDSFKLKGLTATAAVPEPATWGMMIGGFAIAGVAMRRRKSVSVSFA